MASTDTELLEKVKAGLSVGGTYNDTQLSIKTLAVKQYLIGAGITATRLETELGIALITLGVTDIWNLNSGEIKFSSAFELILRQLWVVSMSDVPTNSTAI